MREDDQDETDLAGFAPIIPRQLLRKQLGMTQDEFARALRIPVSTLRNWEQGRVLSDPAARSLSHRCQESESRAQSACDVECKAVVAQIERKAKSGSLHRMLSKKGNPSMDNLAAIFDAVRKSWE